MNKIFSCQYCNREFNRKHNLNRHLQKKKPCVKNEKGKTKQLTSAQFESFLAQFGSNQLNLAQSGFQQKGYNCDFCQYSTNKKGNINRHLKTCKVKKKKDLDLDIINAKIKTLELQAKIISNNTNCHNTNNTTSNSNNTVNNNNTVNITVNDYGKENINYLESDKYKKLINKILGNGMHGLQEYIKYKYCNPQQPENLTIKYTNDRSNNLKVMSNNKWKTRNKLEVIDELYDRDNNVEEVLNVYERINDLEDGDQMDEIQEHFVDEINKYYDEDEEDKEVKEEMIKMKKKTLNHFYDCFKNNKKKFNPFI